MNRLLLIPFVAVCAGFGALVFVNANHAPSAAASGSPDSGLSSRLLSAAAIEESLVAKWDELTPMSYSFSRVVRPGPRYSTPEVFVDLECPAPEQMYVGTIRLQRNDAVQTEPMPHEDFAMVVDRKTGQTAVYSENQWVQFDQWIIRMAM
jgi:hypothetical protein